MTGVNEARKGEEFEAGQLVPDLCSMGALLLLVVIAILLALLLQLLQAPLALFSWQSFSLSVLFCLWAFLGSALLMCRASARLALMSPGIAAFTCMLLVLLWVALLSIAADRIVAGVRWAVVWQVNIDALISRLLIASMVTGVVLRFFWLSRSLRLHEQAELRARLESLQARIRPHFLFNSMNSIASLIGESPQRAESAVEDLSLLFRAILHPRQVLVSWAEEQSLCERYLRIEQLRLGDRLQVHWDTAAVPAATNLPALTLQPLIENAIVHGIQELEGGGELRIEAAVRGRQLRIKVSNPLAEKGSSHEGNGLALDNIRYRLKHIWGEDAGLESGLRDGLWVAEMRLPLPPGDTP